MSETVQLKKTVPVVAEVDVLVAGGGIAGCTAAVAAAREGAKVMVVDRFGYLGGNMGPGMFSGGILHMPIGYNMAMTEGFPGLLGEFVSRCSGYGDGHPGHDYFRDHQVVSYVWARMMQENGVAMMLNSFVCDPIMDGKTVAGLIVENKSGAQAVRAKVVIDATGDADVAFRAGAPTDPGTFYVHPGMYFAIAGVDAPKYLAWLAQVKVSDEDAKWGDELAEKMGSWGAGSLKPFYSLLRRAWLHGEYRFIQPIGDLGVVTVDHGFYKPQRDIVGAQVGISDPALKPKAPAGILSGDQSVMNALETGCRLYIFDTAQFMRRYVPGFENSYLHMIAPYFHARGGRSIVPEYAVTMEDFEQARRFDDVVFRSYGTEAKTVIEAGYDFPYRQLIATGVNGLLAAGRAAIIQPPVNRSRWKMFVTGNVAGVAAALSAKAGVTPSKLDVKELQRALHHRWHIPLGEPERLKDLGIVP